MRGKVEVFSIESDGRERLVAQENNLVVDGAGETIVDMLTTPSSTLGISPRVMDASNWRITAMSFGPAGKNFGNNPVYKETSCVGVDPDLIGATAYYVTSAAIADPSSWVNPDRSIEVNRVVRALWPWPNTGTQFEGFTPLSYTPPFYLPSYPDPLDTKLEPENTAYVNVSADGSISYGQFENRLNWNLSDPSSYVVGAYAPGYDPTTGDNMRVALVSSLEGDFSANPSLHIVTSGGYYASAGGIGSTLFVYNSSGDNADGQGNVDPRGFIRVLPYTLADTTYTTWASSPTNYWSGRAWVSGVGTQTAATDLFATSAGPQIQLTTQIWRDDLNMFSVFGGLHQMGLWTPNVKETLKVSEPSWDWSASDNPIVYRLFAKKTFTEDLTHRQDYWDPGINPGILSTNSLIIKWTLDLRSQHD
tara:strand:- start:57360 stop:58616 length:1257 start_codon:yes stop_codon:yes gene_type:complete